MSANYSQDFFRSPKQPSLYAVVGLGLMAATDILLALIGLGQIASPEAGLDLGDGTESSLWLMLQGLVYLVRFPAYIFTVVMFLVWLNRANKNLSALRAQNTEFSSGWAVGWWFIPFANLVKPFQVVREVWWESDPEFDDEPTFLSASLRSAPTYMGVWWAFWLISNLFANITARVYDPETFDGVRVGGFLFVMTGILSAVAAFLAIKVVRDITARQELRAANVGSVADISLPPPPSFGQNI